MLEAAPTSPFSMTIVRAVAPCARDDSHRAACEANRAGADSTDQPIRFAELPSGQNLFSRQDYDLPE
jgi:hypothetical protein